MKRVASTRWEAIAASHPLPIEADADWWIGQPTTGESGRFLEEAVETWIEGVGLAWQVRIVAGRDTLP